MSNKKYTYVTQKTFEKLSNGMFRVYYNEEPNIEEILASDDEGETTKHQIYSYNIIDVKELSKSSIASSLIREVYSIDDELAILRQKDSKPEEFDEYDRFAEECKAIADSILEKITEGLYEDKK